MKTVTINGKKYDKSRLLRIAEKNGANLVDNDITIVLDCGDAAIALRREGDSLFLVNFGGFDCKANFGAVFAYLA
jgi:hypothetical protein